MEKIIGNTYEELNLSAEKKSYSLKIQSVWKFCLLCFVTVGFYELYWFYQVWKYIKEREKSDIKPFWRAFFIIFFIYSLSEKVLAYAKDKEYQGAYSPNLITLGYIGILLTYKLPAPYWLISFFSFLPLINIMKSLNYLISKEEENRGLNEKFTAGEIGILIIGGLLTLLTFIGTFIN